MTRKPIPGNMEWMKSFPKCVHLRQIHEGHYCIENCKLMGSEWIATPVHCNVVCRLRGGPYMGRQQTDEERRQWILELLAAHFGAYGEDPFIYKIARKHFSQTTITKPKCIGALKTAYRDLLHCPDVDRVCVTGSAIVKGVTSCKDIDIVVVVNDYESFLFNRKGYEKYGLMPKEIRGTPIDYIVASHPGGFHLSYDIFEDVLFRTSNHTRAKVDNTIKEERTTENYGDFDDFLVESWCRQLGTTPDQWHKAVEEADKEWDETMPSRGLGDTVAKIIHKVTSAKPCKSCKERQSKLNKVLSYGSA